MALISCPECGREISDLTPQCPHCGCPIAAVPVPQNNGTRRGIILGIAAFVLTLAVFFFSCPSEEKHRSEVKLVGEKTMKIIAAEQGSVVVNGLTMMFGGQLVDMLVSNLLTVDNYGVVSIGRITNPQELSDSKIVSVGVLGHVFTASPEKLANTLSKEVEKGKDKLTDDIKTGIEENVDEMIDGAVEGIRSKVGESLDKVGKTIDDELDKTIDEFLGDDEPEEDEE